MLDLKWDFRFLQLAETVASWSRDPSTKVGAVAVREKRVLALGFNGLPAGVEDLSERLEDRKIKYAMTNHAETNLLTYAARDGVTLKGSTCYVTLHPCSNCVAQLINAGIKRIVIPVHDIPERWQQSFDLSRQMMEEAGIQFDELGITKLKPEAFDSLVERLNKPPKFDERVKDVLTRKAPWEMSEEIETRLNRIEDLCNTSETLIEEVDKFLSDN